MVLTVSIAIYAFTWAWLLSLQGRRRRWRWWTGAAAALLLGVEMVIIIGQVVRGRASHFNNATPFDSTLFTIMGAAITIVWLLGMIQGVVLLRERIPDPPLAWVIRLGIAISSRHRSAGTAWAYPTAAGRACRSPDGARPEATYASPLRRNPRPATVLAGRVGRARRG